MSIVNVTKKGFKCLRCGYMWIPKDINKKPETCARCRNPYWDRKRKHGKKN